MKQFFKFTLASILGVILGITLMIFALIGIGSALSTSEEPKLADKNSILELDLSKEMFELDTDDNFSSAALVNMDFSKPLIFKEVLNSIEKAKNDPNINGIVISTGLVMSGSAQLQEIREQLLDFKESGKFIYSYSDIYTQKGYWLASVSDSIFINPVGRLDFKGLAAEVTFFKGFQDKYGIKFDVIRHGKYKSAVEPFLSDKMSDANREQTSRLINSIWETYLTDINQLRNIPADKLNEIADNRSAELPADAVKSRLVDAEMYLDEFQAFVKSKIDIDAEEELPLIELKKYAKMKDPNKKAFSRNKIAVIYAEGEIIYVDNGSTNAVKPESMLEAIRQIREDDNVKGVVLRVNSPGGSALSSDIIWRELELLKTEKTFVVSFSNVAASGGYYIACGADKIFASENTITGSIGVFGMIPNLEKAANNIGITSEVVKTNKNSFDFSLTKGASDEVKDIVLNGVESTYATFVKRVADGRNLSPERVDEIGQGRVWSAKDALKLGLVDEIGGLNDAINYVAEIESLDNFRIKSYPEKEDQLMKILDDLSTEASIRLLKKEIGEDAYKVYSEYKNFINLEGTQARLPFGININ